MGLFKQRRGLTPLVATILLVAFSVGLGALVMSWGEEYIEEKAEFVQGTAEIRSGCDAARIDIIHISGVPQACLSANGVDLWIDNGPDIELYNIQARIVGTDGVDTVEDILEQPLLKANAARTTLQLNPTIGTIRQIKLTPKIWTGSDIAICPQSALNVERLPPC